MEDLGGAVDRALRADRDFEAILEEIGGPDKVMLVGEVWQREPSRELLGLFISRIFPGAGDPFNGQGDKDAAGCAQSSCCGEGDMPQTNSGKTDIPQKNREGDIPERNPGETDDPENNVGKGDIPQKEHGDREPDRSRESDQKCETPHRAPSPAKQKEPRGERRPGSEEVRWTRTRQRVVEAPLIFFLFREDFVKLKKNERQLREILKDVRERSRASGLQPAIIGVVAVAADPLKEEEEGDSVCRMQCFLRAVFHRQPGETVQAVQFKLNQVESVLDIKRTAYRALRASLDNTGEGSLQDSEENMSLTCPDCENGGIQA
ncbi:uncharacterized protein C2orf72 homolog [Latimeria chalumnae]|uniref:uncharacterized protein C2orf72 homolog n=1 Tax=Latimeria chalumnae TaxID=7897 RepID=UPI0006D8DE7A|nr:PREDICTED: uncharacterized protein C2orf72 homolog isoform X2 [Latimeria chalumnae]|eukprot:XP_014344680.1 PREDICTED: uncharacterized protein C2orf72 homolog isoform X2 [Latimeria chalumnae]